MFYKNEPNYCLDNNTKLHLIPTKLIVVGIQLNLILY